LRKTINIVSDQKIP